MVDFDKLQWIGTSTWPSYQESNIPQLMWAQTSRPNLGVSATAVPSAVLRKDHVNEVESKRKAV